MATQPFDENLLMLLANSGMYGGGDASYLGMDDSSPYGKVRNRAAFLKDIESMTGVPFIQLAGVGEAPAEEKPSQIRGVYGANPELAKAFEAIDSGTDPLSIKAAYEESIKAGKLPKEGEPGYMSSEDFGKIATEYATERFTASQDKGDSFTLADGSKSKNIPLGGRDIYGNANEFDLWGAPSMDEMRRIVAQLNPVQQAVAPTPKTPTPAGQQDRPGSALELLRSVSPAAAAVPANAPMGRMGDDPSGRGKIYQGARDARLRKNSQAARQNYVRSDANTASMQRLMALRTLLGG